MAQSIQDILRQISKAEKKQDTVQLVELYRKAATYYFKNGDKAKMTVLFSRTLLGFKKKKKEPSPTK